MSDELRRRRPWAWGPLELIRHANGHFLGGSDTDRRIALIGFDNAIEVCIDVYVNLHPSLRKGSQITKEDRPKILSNYHTKIQFLDKHTEVLGIKLQTPIEAIVWFHTLRNELYHSGNGMVPELHVIEGARRASMNVFDALFEESIESMLEAPPSEVSADAARPALFVSQNDEMELLRTYIDFERTLQSLTDGDNRGRRKPALAMWREVMQSKLVDPKWDKVMAEVTKARNEIVHGGSDGLEEQTRHELVASLMQLTDQLRAAPASRPSPGELP